MICHVPVHILNVLLIVMLWHNGKIHQVMISKVFHIMSVIHWTVMYLSRTNLLYTIIIMEGSCTTHDKYDLTVSFMSMKSRGGSRTKRGIHDFHLVINEITGV